MRKSREASILRVGPPPIVTLLTDFGQRDTYVGVMKGVILGICPHCQIIDLTHLVEPQNIAGGALQLERAKPYFPPGTIHVAVVDPGVGTARPALAVATSRAYWIGPDNGLLSRAVAPQEIKAAVALKLPPGSSATFHGRDLFAPAAAHLAAGRPLAELGTPWSNDLQRLAQGGGNRVIWIDHFGNCLLDIHRQGCQPLTVMVKGQRIELARTYGEVPPNSPLALFSSDGYLEIAINGGSAALTLGLKVGDAVELA